MTLIEVKVSLRDVNEQVLRTQLREAFHNRYPRFHLKQQPFQKYNSTTYTFFMTQEELAYAKLCGMSWITEVTDDK